MGYTAKTNKGPLEYTIKSKEGFGYRSFSPARKIEIRLDRKDKETWSRTFSSINAVSFPVKQKDQCGWGAKSKTYTLPQTLFAGINNEITGVTRSINSFLLLPNNDACVAVFSNQNNLGFYFVPGEGSNEKPEIINPDTTYKGPINTLREEGEC